ncbi:hypothetical protein [Geodermatophilus sp. URMC 62]|uniref:hypothetical protein n=1 Tax=Geodermatophilus sp. URMC 62 TaxID=3423414 RepID=UPI00406CA91D
MDVEVAAFDLMDLARPGERSSPDEEPYPEAEYERAGLAADRLDRMDADVVGLPEVLHEEALRDVCTGRYQNPDHVLVRQGFHDRDPQRIGEVVDLRSSDDHLVDGQLSDDRHDRVVSDHGQLVAEIRLR